MCNVLRYLKANNLLTDLVSLEMESNFERPGPLVHLNLENYSETVQNRILKDNSDLREFLRYSNGWILCIYVMNVFLYTIPLNVPSIYPSIV